MGKLKTKKTAAKRFKMTKPRGNKGVKILYNKSGQGHLRTKKSNRAKNRSIASHNVSEADRDRIYKMIKS